MSFQIPEKIKKNKSDFIIQTSINKRKSYNQLLKAIEKITNNLEKEQVTLKKNIKINSNY